MTPSKPPTPSEYAVLAVGLSVLLIGIGVCGFAYAWLGAPARPELVVMLVSISAASTGLGLIVAAAYWLVRRLGE